MVDGDRRRPQPAAGHDADGVLKRDADGIALGGIRTPAVDAPIAVHTGENPSESIICVLFGSTTPFTAEQLAAHYADHDAYVAAVTESAEEAVEDGFLLPSPADDLIDEAARHADVP